MPDKHEIMGPSDMRDRRTGLATASPAFQAQMEAIKSNTSIPRPKRRQMIDAAVAVYMDVDDAQLSAVKAMIKAQTEAEKEAFIYQVRDKFVAMLATLGIDVEMRQLNFLHDFARKIDQFKKNLAADDIDPEFKETVMEMANDAFKRVCKQLIQLTGSLLDKVMGKDGNLLKE